MPLSLPRCAAPGLAWTSWVPMTREALPALAELPGLYRIRATGATRWMYVGQTGRGLRSRLQALAAQLSLPDMPWNDPHTAAPALWAWMRCGVERYEASVVQVPGDQARRLALECEVIWRHRLTCSSSPAANFGRMPDGWTKSANRSSACRGKRDPQQVVDAARALTTDHPATGAIVLECTNMPPYREAVARACGRPVHDVMTLLHTRWAALP